MMSLKQYVKDDAINNQLKSFLSITETLPYKWDELMEMPESRTRWMYDTIIETRKEAEREAEARMEAQRFAKSTATMG